MSPSHWSLLAFSLVHCITAISVAQTVKCFIRFTLPDFLCPHFNTKPPIFCYYPQKVFQY